MLYTIAVILLAFWLLGMVSSHTMGGFIHILLVVSVIVAIPVAVLILAIVPDQRLEQLVHHPHVGGGQ